MDRFESHAKPDPPPAALGGLFSNLPFGLDFLENNWLIALVIIVAAVVYFWLGRSELGLFDLLGGFFK